MDWAHWGLPATAKTRPLTWPLTCCCVDTPFDSDVFSTPGVSSVSVGIYLGKRHLAWVLECLLP